MAWKAVLRKRVDKKMEFRCLLSEVTVLGKDRQKRQLQIGQDAEAEKDGRKRQLQIGQDTEAEDVTVGRDTLQMVPSVSASVHTLPSLPLGPSKPFV